MTDFQDLPASPNPSRSRFMWLRRRFLKLPVWAWILIVLIIGGFSSGSSSKDESSGSATEESTPVQETSPPETPVTETPSTTERVTTTTENLADQRDLELIITAGVLREGEQRLNLVNAIEDDFILERVDIFTVDFVDGDSSAFIFRVEGASGYRTDEIQLESMWDLVSLLSTMWEPDGMLRNDIGTIKPSLAVVVDGNRYVAPYDLMVRLAERNVTRDVWMSLAQA